MMELIYNLREFRDYFGTDKECNSYLYEMKWKDVFACYNCESLREVEMFNNYSEHSGSCFYEECATVKTVFHKLMFTVRKNFEIVF